MPPRDASTLTTALTTRTGLTHVGARTGHDHPLRRESVPVLDTSVGRYLTTVAGGYVTLKSSGMTSMEEAVTTLLG